jgi:hypothetical protein
MPYESSSAASDVSLAAFGLRIIPAMQPSAARGKAAECVALHKPARRRLRRPAGANAIVAVAPDRDDRRDSDVAFPIVSSGDRKMTKPVVRRRRRAAVARRLEQQSVDRLAGGCSYGRAGARSTPVSAGQIRPTRQRGGGQRWLLLP